MNSIDEFITQHLKIERWGSPEVSCYCPFHNNENTASFSISRETGLWHCFNPVCNQSGTIRQLAEKLGTHWGATLNIDISKDELLKELEPENPEGDDRWEEALERISIDYRKPNDVARLSYMIDRGFHPAVLEHFEVGFSEKKQRIVIPARDENYRLLGFIGRAVSSEEKSKYLYSKKFPRSKFIFNLQNAKTYSIGIVTEGSLDAIKIHQAGFPNTVSILGANVSPGQGELLNKYFNELVLFLDNDPPGEAAIRAIMDMCPGKMMWMVQYPDGIKDPGEMSEDQIRDALNKKADYLSYYYNKGEIWKH